VASADSNRITEPALNSTSPIEPTFTFADEPSPVTSASPGRRRVDDVTGTFATVTLPSARTLHLAGRNMRAVAPMRSKAAAAAGARNVSMVKQPQS
jgi:hypothetical protein